VVVLEALQEVNDPQAMVERKVVVISLEEIVQEAIDADTIMGAV
jgi:hypothetical protein